MRLTWLLLMFLMGVAGPSQAGVWKDTAKWSPEMENRFSEWIKHRFDPDFFITWKGGKYNWIKPDCSNVIYFAHLIFAYENKLPFAIVDRYQKPKLITNRTDRFDKYPSGNEKPEEIRVNNFIQLVIARGTTVTLPNDTYPVKLSRAFVKPGCIYLDRNWIAGSGHAYLIKDISDTGVITYISGSRGSKRMAVTEFINAFPDDIYQRNGIRCFIRPDQFRNIKVIPGYSNEQFELDFPLETEYETDNMLSWTNNLQLRLSLSRTFKETDESLKKGFARSFCSLTRQRVQAVHEGYNFYLHKGRCMTRDEDDEYSTYAKDRKLRDYFFFLHELNHRNMVLTRTYLDNCGSIEYTPGKTISISDFGEKLMNYQISSDPHRPIEERWGLKFPQDSKCYE